jgi:PH (Pleckstrin Homology) domain-containing protein
MGLLDGILGNASELEASTIQIEFAQLLVPGERIEKAYQLIRDIFVFTDKRLIFVNRQGITGKKVEYQSIPYRSITRFSIETAGTLDLEAEMKIWLTGNQMPIQLRFNKKLSVYTVHSVLARYVMC